MATVCVAGGAVSPPVLDSRATCSKRTFETYLKKKWPGEGHIIAFASDGVYDFKGDAFYREFNGYQFDRVWLEQDDTTVRFTKGNFQRVGSGGAGIKDARAPDEIVRTVEIVDQAVATSGGYGTKFDPGSRHHHLFDPATGESARRVLDVTVVGPRATDADALATAIFVAPEGRAETLVRAFPGVTAQITRLDGSLRRIGG